MLTRYLSAICFGAVLTAVSTLAAAQGQYILTTATTGGTFYPVGVALSTLTKVKLEPTSGISLSAISSGGSAENLKLMDENQAQFGMLQGLYGSFAWNGTGPVPKAYKDLRSVSMLWQDVQHFLLDKEYIESGNVQDLTNLYEKGAFSIGARNSGTEGSGRYILGQLGIDVNRLNLAYLGFGPTTDAMLNGRVSGANIIGGAPVSAVTRLLAQAGENVDILEITPAQLERINAEFELWSPHELPANTYPNQNEPVTTIASPVVLTVRSDVPEEHVYAITKTMYENLPFLNNIHPATKAMALEKAIAGLPMPLHAGAARYFQEQGLEIPEHLMPITE
ncbi:hypothetical protein SAMN05661010_02119 [Modicisalibacter muralis]|uniref:TRAP transporter solute receptor, TAXI family n=1 Tax=Modicisalibacter muralis TaxID=119000 RepID=A0A1G9LJN3_9GAMM|nr:TAXI family TRAP transporter solute-binding subunit [Halomonas muralis]SDL62053.1 hypothetical protein SAMN05661010_02119 [Halomonas muralis]